MIPKVLIRILLLRVVETIRVGGRIAGRVSCRMSVLSVILSSGNSGFEVSGGLFLGACSWL